MSTAKRSGRRTCPVCRGVFELPDAAAHPTDPFCSERCKLADLGDWLSGRYRIPGPPQDPTGTGPPDSEGERGPRAEDDET